MTTHTSRGRGRHTLPTTSALRPEPLFVCHQAETWPFHSRTERHRARVGYNMLRHNMMRLFTAPDSCSCKHRRDWDHAYNWSSRCLKYAHGRISSKHPELDWLSLVYAPLPTLVGCYGRLSTPCTAGRGTGRYSVRCCRRYTRAVGYPRCRHGPLRPKSAPALGQSVAVSWRHGNMCTHRATATDHPGRFASSERNS